MSGCGSSSPNEMKCGATRRLSPAGEPEEASHWLRSQCQWPSGRATFSEARIFFIGNIDWTDGVEIAGAALEQRQTTGKADFM